MNNNSTQNPGTIGKATSIILAVTFGFLLIALMIGITLSLTILKVDFYEEIFTEKELYQELPAVVVESAWNAIEQKSSDSIEGYLLKVLPRERVQDLILRVIPVDWLQVQTNQVLSSVLAYANLESTSVNISLDLMPIKMNLTGDNGRTILVEWFSTLPDCSGEILQQWMMILVFGSQGDLQLCNPPEGAYSFFEPVLTGLLSEIGDRIPGSVLVPIDLKGNRSEFTNTSMYGVYKILRSVYSYLPWICGGIALLILLFSFRFPRYSFSLLGITTLLAGILGGLGLVALLKSETLVLSFIQGNTPLPDYLLALETLFVEIGNEIVSRIQSQHLVVAGITAGVGVFLLIFSRLFKK